MRTLFTKIRQLFKSLHSIPDVNCTRHICNSKLRRENAKLTIAQNYIIHLALKNQVVDFTDESVRQFYIYYFVLINEKFENRV